MRRVLRLEGHAIGMVALISMSLLGCGGETDLLPREPAEGTVTFDGKPLESGTIQFQPASQAEGVAAGGMITEGHFEIPRDQGPVPGKYSVAIFSTAPSRSGSADGDSAPVTRATKRRQIKDLRGEIPTRYNIQSELVEEVKAGVTNSYTFNLKK